MSEISDLMNSTKYRALIFLAVLVCLIRPVASEEVPRSSNSISFVGNSSISKYSLSKIKVRFDEKEGVLYPSLVGKEYFISDIQPTRLSPDAVSQILHEISAHYQEVGIPATRAVVTKDAFYDSRSGKGLLIKILEGKISKVRIVQDKLSGRLLERKVKRIEQAVPLVEGAIIDSKKLDGSLGLMNRFSRQYIQPILVPENKGIVLEYRVQQKEETAIKSKLDNYGSDRTGNYRLYGSIDTWNLLTPDDHFEIKALRTLEGESSFIGAEYAIPLDLNSSNRIKVASYFSNYTAQDVGLGALGIDFEGQSISVNATYERTIATHKGSYLDGFASLRLIDVEQDQTAIGVPEGQAKYLLPSLGLKYSKIGTDTSFLFGAKIEGNLPSTIDTPSAIGLNNLGRLNAENDFATASIYGLCRTYIDGLLGNDNKRIHEIELNASASSSLGSRLPASFLGVIGGHNNVRGYPVASASGDSNAYLKFDYNLHIPRMMNLSRESSGHWLNALSPRFIGDFTQLDLTLGCFTDIGIVQNNDPLFYENDDKLWSAGLSLGANYKDSLVVKLEYGWVLRELVTPFRHVDNGDGKFYLSLIYNW